MNGYFSTILVILWCILHMSHSNDSNDSNKWKVESRFYGFRFEIIENENLSQDLLIFNKAEDMNCFGWVQRKREEKKEKEKKENSSYGSVGEIRCRIDKGKEMYSWFHQTFPNKVSIQVYEDTKIRLHFSRFKILDMTRNTCFLDHPHKCNDISPAQSMNISNDMKSSISQNTKTEL